SDGGRPARADPRQWGRPAPRGHHHGRQRALGPRAQSAPPAGPSRGHESGARSGGGRHRRRRRGAHAVRVLGRELAAAGDRDLGADGIARGIHRARGGGAAGSGRLRARAGRSHPPRARRARGGGARRSGNAAGPEARSQPVHLLLVAHRAGARRAAPGGRGAQRDQAARGHRRRRGAREAVHRSVGRPRPADPHLRRIPAVEFPAVAARLHGAVRDARALAQRHAPRPVRRDPRLSAARSALRQSPGVMSRNLLVRIAFAVPAIAATLLLVWLGGWPLAVVLGLLGVLGTREVYDLARAQGIEPLEWVGFIGAALCPLATYWVKGYAEWEPVVYGAAVWLLVVLVVAAARGPDRRPLTAVAVT